MNNSRSAALTVFFVAILVAMGGVAVLKGGLYIGKHEGDTLHLMQIVFRMADGQVPHIDFMTPIGVLAFWPIAMLVKAGLGMGMAIIWSQVLMALVFLPIVIWVARTRLSRWVGALFGLFVMVLLLALVHGEAERSVSMSMHYNRLAWAAAFVAIVLAVLPSGRKATGTVDGVIIGAMVSMMALIKMTYFVSFAGPILIALLLTRQRRALLTALLTGAAVIGVVTLWGGVAFWAAYASDLLTVAGSEVRSAPGAPLSAIMGAPAYLAGSIAALAGVIFLRQAKVDTGGLILLLLLPGFFYVTYQNYGNDPQWLMLLAVLLLALRGQADDVANGFGWKIKDAIGITAAMALALTAPSFFNLAYSPFRHMSADAEKYVPLLPNGGVHQDLYGFDARLNQVDVRRPLDGSFAALERYDGRDPRLEFQGEEIADCAVEVGLPRVMNAIAQDLSEAGLASGKSVLATDIFTSYWLFGELEPLRHGAPWYYGGLPGLEDADYVLVPFCPVLLGARAQIAMLLEDEVEAGRLELNEVRRTDLYILYEVTGRG